MSLFLRMRRFLMIFLLGVGLTVSPSSRATTLEDLVTTSTVVSTLAPLVGGGIAFLFTKCSRACWQNVFGCCRDCREACGRCGKPRPLHRMAQELDRLDSDLVQMLDLFGKALDENMQRAKSAHAKAMHVTNDLTDGDIYAFTTQAFEVMNLTKMGNYLTLESEKQYIKNYFFLGGKVATATDVSEALLEGANLPNDRGRWEGAYFDYVRKHLGGWFTKTSLKILFIEDPLTKLKIFYLGDTHGDGFVPYVRIAMYNYPPEGEAPSRTVGDGQAQAAATLAPAAGENEFTKRLTARYWRKKHDMRYRSLIKQAEDFQETNPDEARERTLGSMRVSELLALTDDQTERRGLASLVARVVSGTASRLLKEVATLVHRDTIQEGYTSEFAPIDHRTQPRERRVHHAAMRRDADEPVVLMPPIGDRDAASDNEVARYRRVQSDVEPHRVMPEAAHVHRDPRRSEVARSIRRQASELMREAEAITPTSPSAQRRAPAHGNIHRRHRHRQHPDVSLPDEAMAASAQLMRRAERARSPHQTSGVSPSVLVERFPEFTVASTMRERGSPLPHLASATQDDVVVRIDGEHATTSSLRGHARFQTRDVRQSFYRPGSPPPRANAFADSDSEANAPLDGRLALVARTERSVSSDETSTERTASPTHARPPSPRAAASLGGDEP